jgi:hypothetical protein
MPAAPTPPSSAQVADAILNAIKECTDRIGAAGEAADALTLAQAIHELSDALAALRFSGSGG